MNKKTLIFGILIWLIIAGGVFWWWQKGKKTTKEVEEKPSVSVTETTVATGKIIPPEGIDPKSLTIIGLNEITTPDAQGNFTGKIYREGVAMVSAVPENMEFALQQVVISSEGKPDRPIIIDYKSTAVAHVFDTPFLITNDPEEAKRILAVIERDPNIEELAKAIETVFKQKIKDPLSAPVYQQALKKAIESVLATLNP